MEEVRVPRETLQDAIQRLEEAAQRLEGVSAALRAVLEAATDGAADAPSADPDGPVIFLEPRRQFIVSRPSERQLADLSELGHLEYADDRGNYSFVVREQDLWRIADWRRVEELVRRYAPEHPHFHEWAFGAWDKRNVFAIEDAPDGGGYFILRARSEEELAAVLRRDAVRRHLYAPNRRVGGLPAVRIKQAGDPSFHRHALKRTLLGLGYPVADRASLAAGEPIRIQLRPEVTADPRWEAYQKQYVEEAYRLGAAVLVAPPGAGKTVAAIGLMCRCQTSTLILTPQRELAEQWRREIAAKTTWPVARIGMYHGGEKRIEPVTIANLSSRCGPGAPQALRQGLGRHHLRRGTPLAGGILPPCRELPVDSPVGPHGQPGPRGRPGAGHLGAHRAAHRRGLGPALRGRLRGSARGELRKLPFPSDYHWQAYRRARGARAALIAAQNPAKIAEVRRILQEHPLARALIFVEWLDHGRMVARELDLPFVSGETPHHEREQLYQEFRDGKRRALVVSRVGNQGLDLPDADLAIMLSWQGGSR